MAYYRLSDDENRLLDNLTSWVDRCSVKVLSYQNYTFGWGSAVSVSSLLDCLLIASDLSMTQLFFDSCGGSRALACGRLEMLTIEMGLFAQDFTFLGDLA